MSGVKRTLDSHTLKVRDIVVQNSNNTFPDAGGVVYARDEKGHMVVDRNLTISQLLINDVATIDGSGNISAKTLTLTADVCGNAIQTTGNMYVNNANIYVDSPQNDKGKLSTTNLRLIDISTNTVTRLYTQNNHLYWNNESGTPLDISTGVNNLKVEPTYTNFTLLNTDTSFGIDRKIVPTINRILRLFNSRRIFIGLA